MSRVLVPLADGCEELEAVSIIDILRRGGVDVVTAGLKDGPVTGSRKTVLVPDTTMEKAAAGEYDMVVLPGGLPGSDHLQKDERVRAILKKTHAAGKLTGAICAAPKVLADVGLLDGKKATSYPGVLGSLSLKSTKITTDPVVKDGTVITSRSVGTAMDFALTILEALEGKAKRDQVEKALSLIHI